MTLPGVIILPLHWKSLNQLKNLLAGGTPRRVIYRQRGELPSFGEVFYMTRPRTATPKAARCGTLAIAAPVNSVGLEALVTLGTKPPEPVTFGVVTPPEPLVVGEPVPVEVVPVPSRVVSVGAEPGGGGIDDVQLENGGEDGRAVGVSGGATTGGDVPEAGGEEPPPEPPVPWNAAMPRSRLVLIWPESCAAIL